jgi:hypothetical protein
LRADTYRTWPKSISYGAEKLGEVRDEFFPIGDNQPSPVLNFTSVFSVEARFHGLRIDHAVRLSKIGKTTDTDSTLQTQKSANTNPNDIQQAADPSPVISQRLQAIGPATVQAVLRLLNLLLEVLF